MAKIACCYNCAFAFLDQEHTLECYYAGILNWPACANHPESYGGMCPNYRPRPERPEGDVKQIPLGDGYYAYVDAADYEWLNRWQWHLHGGYAVRREKKKLIYMHREIMQPPKGMIVDHKNRNRLDNTRDNLLVCTQQENCYNRTKRNGSSSRFRGVYFSKRVRRWVARITFQGRRYHLGCFVEEVEAARAYDCAAVEYFGESAWVNFPQEWPPERRAEVYVQRDAAKRKTKSERATDHGSRATPTQRAARRATKQSNVRRQTHDAKRKTRAEGPDRSGCRRERRKFSALEPPAIGVPRTPHARSPSCTRTLRSRSQPQAPTRRTPPSALGGPLADLGRACPAGHPVRRTGIGPRLFPAGPRSSLSPP